MTGRAQDVADRSDATGAGGAGVERRRRRLGCGLVATARPSALSPQAHAAILTAIELGRRSRNRQAAVLARFVGAMPFRLTVEAEARQVAALEALLRRRGLAVPPRGAEASVGEPLPEVPASLGAACLEAATAKEETAALFERVLGPLVTGHADVERVFARIVEAARERHVPVLRHWADHHRADGRGERR